MNKNNDLKKAIEMAIIKPESENMNSLKPYEHNFSEKYKREIAKAKKIADKKSGKRNIGFYYKVSSVIAAALVLTGVLTFTANEKLRNAINNWHVGDEFLAPTEDKTDTTYTTIITDTTQSPSGSQEPDIIQTATEDSNIIDTTADKTEKNTNAHSSTNKSSYVITDISETTASIPAALTKPSHPANTTRNTIISSQSPVITTKITSRTTVRTTKKTSNSTQKATTQKPATDIITTKKTKHTTKVTTMLNASERPVSQTERPVTQTSLVTATYIVIATGASNVTMPVTMPVTLPVTLPVTYISAVTFTEETTTTTTTATSITAAAGSQLYQEKNLLPYSKTYITKIKWYQS